MFYVMYQNPSYGHYAEINGQSAVRLAIEADDEKAAKAIALTAGVYFEGVRKGIDCPCCGDRWSEYFEEYRTLPENKTATSGKNCLVIFDDGTMRQYAPSIV